MAGDSLIDNLEYKDAKKMIQLPIIDENHRVLENASRHMEDSALICENPEIQLNQMRTEVFFLIPDFLVEPEDKNLKFLKKNIELNKKNLEDLCVNFNNFIVQISKTLNCLYSPFQGLKREINNIIFKFEETIKGLCIPLISKKEGINSIDTSGLTEKQMKELEVDKLIIDKKINKFLDESDKLNKNYNRLFLKILESVEIICEAINEIPLPVQDLQNEVEEGISKYEEFLESITDENKNQNFGKKFIYIISFIENIKNEFEKIVSNSQNKCKILGNQYKKRNESFYQIKAKVKESIDKLTSEAEKIKIDIDNVRENYKQKKIELPFMKLSEIIIEKIYNEIDKTIEKEKEELDKIKPPSIEPQKIEVDILYIMDITGSMEGYVNATKNGLIDIMNKIISNCNEIININLGFIGYKDIAEIISGDYINEDFTRNYSEVKEKISEIVVGGGDDTAEDVTFAFELAVDKKWGENNIKFAILVCDAPCHGIKYHEQNLLDDYKEGVPNRKNIEDLVSKLCDMNISLCCVKLSEETNIMYSIFENIYKNKKNDKCGFYLVSLFDPKNLADLIIRSSSNAIKQFA